MRNARAMKYFQNDGEIGSIQERYASRRLTVTRTVRKPRLKIQGSSFLIRHEVFGSLGTTHYCYYCIAQFDPILHNLRHGG